MVRGRGDVTAGEVGNNAFDGVWNLFGWTVCYVMLCSAL